MNNEVYNILKDELGLTDQEIERYLELYALAQEFEPLERESELATEYRRTPMPEGRRVGQDRLYVAASPLEFASTVGQQLYGDYRQRKLDEERSDLLAEQVKRRAERLRFGSEAERAEKLARVPVPELPDVPAVPQSNEMYGPPSSLAQPYGGTTTPLPDRPPPTVRGLPSPAAPMDVNMPVWDGPPLDEWDGPPLTPDQVSRRLRRLRSPKMFGFEPDAA